MKPEKTADKYESFSICSYCDEYAKGYLYAWPPDCNGIIYAMQTIHFCREHESEAMQDKKKIEECACEKRTIQLYQVRGLEYIKLAWWCFITNRKSTGLIKAAKLGLRLSVILPASRGPRTVLDNFGIHTCREKEKQRDRIK